MTPDAPASPVDREAFARLVDPELRPYLDRLPAFDISDPVEARRHVAERSQAARVDVTGLEIDDRVITSPADSHDIRVRVYRPPNPRGALVFLHGGGFTIGSLDSHHDMAVRAARECGTVVVSVDYRLAPEHPHPAAVEDAHGALVWLSAQIDLVDAGERIVVGGISAGAGVAAGACFHARDQATARIDGQWLLQPSLDDRPRTVSRQRFTVTPLWSNESSSLAWRYYLGGATNDVPVSAAPNRASDLTDLPEAYVAVSELDALRDEGLDYATRMLAAGVSVEVQVFRRTFHGSQRIMKAAVSRRMLDDWYAALGRLLHGPRPRR